MSVDRRRIRSEPDVAFRDQSGLSYAPRPSDIISVAGVATSAGCDPHCVLSQRRQAKAVAAVSEAVFMRCTALADPAPAPAAQCQQLAKLPDGRHSARKCIIADRTRVTAWPGAAVSPRGMEWRFRTSGRDAQRLGLLDCGELPLARRAVGWAAEGPHLRGLLGRRCAARHDAAGGRVYPCVKDREGHG